MEYLEYKRLVEIYKVQNPVKYEMKKDVFEKKLKELSGEVEVVEEVAEEVEEPKKRTRKAKK